MKTLRQVFALTVLTTAILSCSSPLPQIDDEHPYAIKITEERSYYQAEKIKERLKEMGLDSYIIAVSDTAVKAQWYNVFIGAEENLDKAKELRKNLEETHEFSDLLIVNYLNVKELVLPFNKDSIAEIKRISGERPDIDDKIFDVISKFPNNNMFYVEKVMIFNTPDSTKDKGKFSSIYQIKTDLPRGIKKKLLLEKSQCFSEVIYKDNIYGDRVTIDILKLRKEHEIGKNEEKIQKAGLFASAQNSSDKQLTIAGYFADLILNTGDYLFEEKVEIEVSSFSLLKGYRVVIEPKRDYFRTYLILVDPNLELVLFSQSTDKTEEELNKILADFGKSNGLLDYDEFHNAFFTIPHQLAEEDLFISFSIDRLGWSYAKAKGYTSWSKLFVGHWSAKGYFYNSEYGLWSYGIFDLLTEEKANYGDELYASEIAGVRRNVKPIDVYGTSGFLVLDKRLNRKTWNYYLFPYEINFRKGRYACMVDNTEQSWLDKNELLKRAQALQLIHGGHIAKKENKKDGEKEKI